MNRFLGFYSGLQIALGAIVANKVRALLTMLGIIIGIVAVTTTMTAANGLQQNFRNSFSALGADVVYVSRMPWIMMGNFADFANRPQITEDQALAFSERMQGKAIVDYNDDNVAPLRYGNNTLNGINVIGSTDKLVMISDMVPEKGRFFLPMEVDQKRAVCIIGADIETDLFEGTDPLGKQLRVGRNDCEVIGVMEKQGASSAFDGPNLDRRVYLPFTTMKKFFGYNPRNRSVSISAKPLPGIDPAELEFEVIGTMRTVRGLSPTQADDFAINKLDSLMESYNSVMGVVLLVGILITGISLFVGGIGVMNIMFVSVTERTKEIGIRKAIGAKRNIILTQFIAEAIIICAVGGLMGIVFTTGITALIDKLLFPASISPVIAFAALLIAALTGVISGFVPAWKAAALKPVDALRYE